MPNNLRCSPKPPLSTDLSLIEEGKASPSEASTINVTTVSPTNAHKVRTSCYVHFGSHVKLLTGIYD